MEFTIKSITRTQPEITLTILRVALGVMILPHGLQKTFGLFGGYGFSGTMQFFTENMGIPYIFALLAIVAEFAGGVGLILGLFSRIAALGVGITMLVAAMMVHAQNGFFMNWLGNQKGEGIEFFLLAVAISIAIVFKGSGKLSLDRVFFNKD